MCHCSHIIPALRRWRQIYSCGSFIGLPVNKTCEFQATERLCLKRKQNREAWGLILKVVLWPSYSYAPPWVCASCPELLETCAWSWCDLFENRDGNVKVISVHNQLGRKACNVFCLRCGWYAKWLIIKCYPQQLWHHFIWSRFYNQYVRCQYLQNK